MDSPEFRVWLGIRQRCLNPRHSGYYKYGARGITIAEEWREDFAAFFAHVGRKPSNTHQLDRVDNTRGYAPGNVRWSTPKENGRNKRNNVLITINGVTKCAAAWDEHCGFMRDGKVVLNRYKRGWRGAELLYPLRKMAKPRRQSPEERAKRSETMKRNRAAGLYKNAGLVLSATKKRQFVEGTAYNLRDERGCFVGKSK